MTEQEAEQLQNKLTKQFQSKHADLVVHVDLVNGTNKINISFFWDRISLGKWNEAKTFRFDAKDYQKVLETDIIPFFQ
jgi:hypothetical protein